MEQTKNMEISDESVERGPGHTLGGGGGTVVGGNGPVTLSGSNSDPGSVLSGEGVKGAVQVSPGLDMCIDRRSENAKICDTRPRSDSMNASFGDASFQNKMNNSRLDDFNSTNDDAQSVSNLDMTGDNSIVNYGDITYVDMCIPEGLTKNPSQNDVDNIDFDRSINLNDDTNIVKDPVRDTEQQKTSDNTERDDEEADDTEKEENPKKKRISNSERRFRKKLRMEEEKGKEFREKNKNKPLSELQKKVNEAYKKKLSYAQCAKTHEMLEIRSSNLDVMLDQPDFDKIDMELLYKYAGLDVVADDPENINVDDDDEIDGNTEIKDCNKNFYGLVGGISQGCCWFACDNVQTADFVREHAPNILPPAPYTDSYKYVVYSASEKPFRYMKCKVPKKMWNSKKVLQALFKASNNCLKSTYPTDDGTQREVHFKITAGCHNYKEEIINNKFFWVQMEIDEKLMPTLTGTDQRGALKLGASPISLIGGGIVSETKKQIEKQLTGSLGDLVEEEIRG
jgi:hypothetical protein